MSFYDWYCDLPPASPQVWGEQTDVPESADWYNSTYIIAWGSNVPQTRTPDAHFFTEVRYKGAKTVAVTPDYSRSRQAGRHLAAPQAGHRRGAGDGHGPRGAQRVLLQAAQPLLRRLRAPLHRPAAAGDARRSTPLPDGSKTLVPDRYLRASDFNGKLGQDNNPEWKTVAFDTDGRAVLPNGSIGFRWGAEGRVDQGKWNLENKEARHGADVKLKLSVHRGRRRRRTRWSTSACRTSAA